MKRAVLISGVTAMALALTAGVASAKGGHGKHGPRVSFEQLDVNGDGQITKDEIAAAATARFNEADTNGDGNLSAEELAAASERAKEERIAKMIEKRDENGDGVLSQAEMQPKEDRTDKMFERMDENGDGVISAEEFEAAKSKRKGKRGDKGKKDESNDG
ncbi:MAG: EF-hand domain-containing protein [Cognatishimia sp.]|uniref:EF-hand domain-containing protein n=1 Tax=Cognatishimia sp. TaxID=2211648 RepID=UPI003B8DF56B